MTKYHVKLGDVFWVPFSDHNGYVIAGEEGFISVRDCISGSTDLNIYTGVAYLFNLFETIPHDFIDLNCPQAERMHPAHGELKIEWTGVDK